MSWPESTIAHSTLWVALTLLSMVYRLCLADFIEYGAASCSARWMMASGRSVVQQFKQPVVVLECQFDHGDVASRPPARRRAAPPWTG